MGGWSSASSMAVIPTAQRSQSWLYPPFLSTAATSGAILKKISQKRKPFVYCIFLHIPTRGTWSHHHYLRLRYTCLEIWKISMQHLKGPFLLRSHHLIRPSIPNSYWPFVTLLYYFLLRFVKLYNCDRTTYPKFVHTQISLLPHSKIPEK